MSLDIITVKTLSINLNILKLYIINKIISFMLTENQFYNIRFNLYIEKYYFTYQIYVSLNINVLIE